MVLITGTVRLPPDRLAQARPAMRAMIEASRAEEGCLDYSWPRTCSIPRLIRVTELCADQAALDRHFRSAHIAAWRAAWPDLGLGQRNLREYEVGPAVAT